MTTPLHGLSWANWGICAGLISNDEGSNGDIYLNVTDNKLYRKAAGVWTEIADFNTGSGGVPTSRTISTTAPLTGGGDLSANRTFAMAAATNAVPGYATAAQITALEAATTRVAELQAGLPLVETIATGAISVIKKNTFLAPAGDVTFTLAAGTNGQEKLLVLTEAHTVSVTEIAGWTGKAPGDYAHAIYLTGVGWVLLDNIATP